MVSSSRINGFGKSETAWPTFLGNFAREFLGELVQDCQFGGVGLSIRQKERGGRWGCGWITVRVVFWLMTFLVFFFPIMNNTL